MSAVLVELGVAFARVAFITGFVLNIAGLLTWVERKQSAVMQDRVGANRASIFGFRVIGLFHMMADPLKLMFKEDFVPARADRALFIAAPIVSVFFAMSGFFTIPFGDVLRIGGYEINLQAVPLNAGILFVFAMLSMGVYGVMLAGWASANNYALLGGQRAAALMISAEVAIGASIMGVVHGPRVAGPAGDRPRPGRALVGDHPAVGHLHPAAGPDPLPDRRHRLEQAHPVRPAGGRVGDHRATTSSTAR